MQASVIYGAMASIIPQLILRYPSGKKIKVVKVDAMQGATTNGDEIYTSHHEYKYIYQHMVNNNNNIYEYKFRRLENMFKVH